MPDVVTLYNICHTDSKSASLISNGDTDWKVVMVLQTWRAFWLQTENMICQFQTYVEHDAKNKSALELVMQTLLEEENSEEKLKMIWIN